LSRFLRICSQSSKKVLKWHLKKCFLKKSIKVSKNAFFHNFFNGFEISVFWHLFWFFQKIFFLGHISTFFKLWSQTRKKRLKKPKNLFSKCVLDFNFAPITGSVFFIFKKKSHSLYPSVYPSSPSSDFEFILMRNLFFAPIGDGGREGGGLGKYWL
jgi:hypothetical protein